MTHAGIFIPYPFPFGARRPEASATLGKQLIYGNAFVGDLEGALGGRHDDEIVRQTEGLGDGGIEVLHGDGFVFDLAGGGISLAVLVAALDTATREQASERTRVVIATIFVLGFDLRRAAKFCRHDDQRVFQNPAFVEVGDECGVGLIEFFATPFHGGEIIIVRVPTTELDFNEAHAVFDEATRQETSLREATAAVEIFGGGRFVVEIEGFQILRVHQAYGFLIEVLVGLHIGIGIATVKLFVQLIGECEAAVEIFFRDRFDASRILQALFRAADGSGGIFCAEKATARVIGWGIDGDEAGDFLIDATAEFQDPRTE